MPTVSTTLFIPTMSKKKWTKLLFCCCESQYFTISSSPVRSSYRPRRWVRLGVLPVQTEQHRGGKLIREKALSQDRQGSVPSVGKHPLCWHVLENCTEPSELNLQPFPTRFSVLTALSWCLLRINLHPHKNNRSNLWTKMSTVGLENNRFNW